MPRVNLIDNIVGGQSVSDIRIANLAESVNMFEEHQGDGASATSLIRTIDATNK